MLILIKKVSKGFTESRQNWQILNDSRKKNFLNFNR